MSSANTESPILIPVQQSTYQAGFLVAGTGGANSLNNAIAPGGVLIDPTTGKPFVPGANYTLLYSHAYSAAGSGALSNTGLLPVGNLKELLLIINVTGATGGTAPTVIPSFAIDDAFGVPLSVWFGTGVANSAFAVYTFGLGAPSGNGSGGGMNIGFGDGVIFGVAYGGAPTNMTFSITVKGK